MVIFEFSWNKIKSEYFLNAELSGQVRARYLALFIYVEWIGFVIYRYNHNTKKMSYTFVYYFTFEYSCSFIPSAWRTKNQNNKQNNKHGIAY